MFYRCAARHGVLRSLGSFFGFHRKVPGSGEAAAPPPPEDVVLRRVTQHRRGSTTLDHVEAVVRARRTWRQYDPDRRLPVDTLQRVLEATTRAPTAFNLQGWTMVVVQEPQQKLALSKAALGQRHVLEASATVVFAGDTEPECNAPLSLEMSLDAKALPPGYGPGYLRNIYYFLHGGPLQVLAAAKSVLSTAYSGYTGVPLLSVPVNRTGYAWKQTMIPATTFVQLATAAGWETCILEGIDQEAVRKVVGLPPRFTVPVIVTVGYPLVPKDAKSGPVGQPETPRFTTKHFVRFDRYT